MSLATAIKKHRKALDMTQEELAKALGLKRVTIATYERGAVRPSLNVARSMALLFEVSIESLFTDDPTDDDPAALVHAAEGTS